MLNLSSAAEIATVIGILVGALSLAALFYQMRKNTRVNEAMFMLELERVYSEHRAVFQRFHPEGDWGDHSAGPHDQSDWSSVIAALGFFEHCEIVIRNSVVQERDIFDCFAYDAAMVASHPWVISEIKQHSKHYSLVRSFFTRAKEYKTQKEN